MASRYRGVTLHKRTGQWMAQIVQRPKYVFLGRFDDPEEAARTWDMAARLIRGPAARLNFPGADLQSPEQQSLLYRVKQLLVEHGFTILYG